MALLNNLEAYWKLDESSGSAADATGHSNTLTNNNTVPFVTGKLNNGADFELSSSHNFSIADGSQTGLDFTGNFSFSAWINLEQLPSTAGTEFGIIAKYDDDSPVAGYEFFIGTDDKIYIQWVSTTTDLNRQVSNAALTNTATWMHIVVTVNTSGSKIIYKDGSVFASTNSINQGGAMGGNAKTFFLGAQNASNSAVRFFDGKIDEVGVWSRLLTSDEVTELYNGGSGFSYPFSSSATSTHTVDALLKRTLTATHTLDALRKLTVTAVHTADALKKKALTAAHTISAYIQEPTPTLTHTLDALLFKSRLQLEKTLLARVSLPSGQFLKAWPKITFNGFTKQLNGGPSECVIQYAVPFDYDGADLREGNDVELVISDADTALAADEDGRFNTRTIYRGYISLIDRDIDNRTEAVTVHLLGYYTQLSLDVLKEGSQTTLYSEPAAGLTITEGDLDAADIGLMARTVIDRFNEEHGGGQIFYDADDVPDTSSDATYVFNQKTYREAIDVLKSLAPAGVYWYVDETGRFRFKAASTTPDHTFILGRHFSRVHVERSLEKVRNVLVLWNGDSIYKQYTDPASIAQYGRRTERINDYGIADEDAADAAAEKFLAENKDAAVKLVCSIIDNNNARGLGADIEDIQPGDTCSFTGFSSMLSDIFRDNMLITSVRYTLDAVEIEVELVKSGLVDVQARQTRDIANIGNGGLGVPASFT